MGGYRGGLPALQQVCSIVGCGHSATDKHHIIGREPEWAPTVWVCKDCHGRLHGVRWSPNHADLVRNGIAKAKAAGRVGGNPGLRARDQGAIEKAAKTRRQVWRDRVIPEALVWLRVTESMPGASKIEVADALNITSERLRRALKMLVGQGLADPKVLERTPRRTPPRLAVLSEIVGTLAQTMSLREVAKVLEGMGELTPRGHTHWQASSVKQLLVAG